jgi:anti-sigma B factor antagonist
MEGGSHIMDMKEQMKGDVLFLIPVGELMGGDETKVFQDRIYKAIEEGVIHVVLDMEAVKWMNSSGLGTLMSGLTTLRGSGGDLRLANVSDRVRRPIEITKLDKVISMFASVDEAVNSFALGG